jgi:shikimate kinase
VVVVGPPAAGKTRVAKRLGRILDVEVVDTDTEVVKRWGPIPDLFATHGEDFFRAQERDAVENALTTSGVVALGGGAVVDSSYTGRFGGSQGGANLHHS